MTLYFTIPFVQFKTMENSSLDTKQQYLRQNILDAGYDAETFVEFCSQKHNLDDLENWSMQELTDIVTSFIHSLQDSKLSYPTIDNEHCNEHLSNKGQPVKGGQTEHKNNMGLVFSDDDWNVLLAGPSLGSTSNEFSNMPLQLDLMHQSHVTPQNVLKDYPLSPPSSINTVKPSSQVTNLQSMKSKQPTLKIAQLIDPLKQQTGKKFPQINNLINLSNIRLNTSKEKAFPSLPQITNVKVIKTEQIPRSFFQSGYTLYHIQFMPSEQIIQRRFTDLIKVRNALQRLYPFLRLPYLEPDGWISTSQGKDSETLIKYKLMVDQFIKYIVMTSNELKNSQIVRILCDFTSTNPISREDLKIKLQTFEHVTRPKYIGDIILTDNSVLIPPVGNGQKVIMNTMNLLTELDVVYDKLKKQMQSLFQNYDLLIQSLGDVSSTFQSLQTLLKKYNMDNNEKQEKKVFEGLKQMTRKFSQRIDNEYMIFQTKIKSMFRYEKDNMTTLKQVIECRNKIHYEYVKRGQPTLTSNSLKTEGSNIEIESSTIHLEQPVCNNKNSLAVQQAFWSFLSTRQISRYWTHLRERISQHLTMIAHERLSGENQNLNFWNSMIKQCII